MTDNPDEIAAALRAELNREAALIRAAIQKVQPHLSGMSPDVAAQEVGRVLRPLIHREDISRFGVVEVLAEYVVREAGR